MATVSPHERPADSDGSSTSSAQAGGIPSSSATLRHAATTGATAVAKQAVVCARSELTWLLSVHVRECGRDFLKVEGVKGKQLGAVVCGMLCACAV